LETESRSRRSRLLVGLALCAVALGLAAGAWMLWAVTREVPAESGPRPLDEEVSAALAVDYPSYEVLGYDLLIGRGANATQGPGSEFASEAWRFALRSSELPGQPLVVSYMRFIQGEGASDEWHRLDEFFAGPSVTQLQVGLASAFAADHPAESCLGAYEIDPLPSGIRVFRVGYHRESGGLVVESEYTYTLASGEWVWDSDAEYPDLRWGNLHPELP